MTSVDCKQRDGTERLRLALVTPRLSLSRFPLSSDASLQAEPCPTVHILNLAIIVRQNQSFTTRAQSLLLSLLCCNRCHCRHRGMSL